MTALIIRQLTPSLLQDWLTFFDRDAFADNREWSGCYCHFYHADHARKDWDTRTPDENPRASSGLINAGHLSGYLAYVEGRPVGWCQAAPRLGVPNVQNDEALAVSDAGEVGSIVCFIVAQGFRQQGVATRLLAAACEGFRKAGLRTAEAYPRRAPAGDAGNYHGPLAMYLKAGFMVYRETEDVSIVRRALAEVAK